MPSRKLKVRDAKTGRASGPLRVRVPEAPDFGPHLEEVLTKAGAKSTPDARLDLDSRLQLAWAHCAEHRRSQQKAQLSPTQQRALLRRFEQLERSIKKTKRLLGVLRKQPVSATSASTFALLAKAQSTSQRDENKCLDEF